MLTTEVRHLTFDAKQSLRPGALRRYREVVAGSELDAATLQECTSRRLREMVNYAASTSPFYAERLSADSYELAELPVLTRQHLKQRYPDICARNIRASRGLPVASSGTTGSPVRALLDRAAHDEAIGWRVIGNWGIHPGDDCAIISSQSRTRLNKAIHDIKWFPTHRRLLTASLTTPTQMREFAQLLCRMHPPFISGYAGAILIFASFLQAEGITVPRPKAVCVTGSPQTEYQREFLSKVFRAPVFDQYGAAEITWIAADCGLRNGLHVQNDFRIVEILDDDGKPVPDGTWGRIVVTDLLNRVFPLLRYEIGDVGRFLEGQCQCGSSFPRLDHIRGRLNDVFRFADGSVMITGLATACNDIAGFVHQYKLHQVNMQEIVLYCVPQNSNSETLLGIQKAADRLQTRVGNRARVHVRCVEALDHDGRGKNRFVISDVPETVA